MLPPTGVSKNGGSHQAFTETWLTVMVLTICLISFTSYLLPTINIDSDLLKQLILDFRLESNI